MMDGYRRTTVLLFCVAVAVGGALMAQQAPPGLVNQLMRAPGTLIGQGQNAKATGPFGLKTYRIDELTLAQPVTVAVGGKPITTSKAWRLSITGGPFAARAIPAVIEIDGVAAGVALESADQSALRLVTFDPAALHEGAQVSVAYGDVRSTLSETLHVSR